MAIITTHEGGPYYKWRVEAIGSPPPAQFDEDTTCEGVLYHDWQHGRAKADAATDFYNCQLSQAGGAVAGPPSGPDNLPTPIPETGPGGAYQPPPEPAPPPPPPTTGEQVDIGTIASAGDASLPTYYGKTYSQGQIAVVRDVMNVGLGYKAPRVVLEAAVYALMGESDISDAPGGGYFQTSCDTSAYNGGSDYVAQAHSFFNGGTCFARGALSYASEYDTAWQIANATEENAIWASSRGDSYARDGYTTAQLTAEAAYAVSYFLPGLGTTGVPAPPAANPPQSPAGLDTLMHQLNWAGDFENLWAYVQGGADEAAKMADDFYTYRINQIDQIGW